MMQSGLCHCLENRCIDEESVGDRHDPSPARFEIGPIEAGIDVGARLG